MNHKIVLAIISLIISTSLMSQNNPRIALGHYQIDPVEKVVYTPHYWERDYPDGIHAWGTDWLPDTTIHKLVFNPIIVREPYRIPEIEGYNIVYDLYEENGEYFIILSRSPFNARKIQMPDNVDFSKLKPVLRDIHYSSFFYDDNHLYFEDHNKYAVERVASSKNKIMTYPNYFVYDGFIYQYDKREPIGSVDKVRVLDQNMNGEDIYFIHDPEMHEWKQLSLRTHFGIEENRVYMPVKKNAKDTKSFCNLFATPDGFALLDILNNGTEITQFDEAYFFDSAIKDYVKIDPEKFELYKVGHRYDGQNYFESTPISDIYNMPALRWLEITCGGGKDWLSDGKIITQRYVIKGNQAPVEVTNIDQLKNVETDMFTDGINFYWYDNSKIRVIPIESLGIPVELNLTEKAYVK